jgi:sialate O-acetylesterase
MLISHTLLRLAGTTLAVSLSATAAVRLPSVLGEHMVVQRGLPVHVWGLAEVGEAVSATFRGESRSATADDLGRWSIYLPPGEAGGPFEMTIQGSNTITLRDVLAGDVWVASGQSNMEFAVRGVDNASKEMAGAKYPKIRLFHVKNRSAEYPQEDADADAWVQCDPETVASFSAVAYFFGRDLNEKTGVPVGLISTSWGGTPVDAWTSLDAIGADASLMPVISEWAKMMDAQPAALLRWERQLKQWEQSVERAKAEGKPEPGRPWAPNQGQSWRPAGLYNAMIAPLTPFPIRGAIWYQGESNTSQERAPLYSHLFQTMIRDWRRAWGAGDFPFYFVQLANFKTGANSHWPELREAQRATLALANTGMAVTIDIGNPDDIHPKNKQDVGARLALWARATLYGENIEYSGPLFRQAARDGSALRVWFDHAGGLTARGGALTGFEIAGADRKFVTANARIDGSTVVVSGAPVENPVYVRYGWSDNPACNLYNAAGLPASPFRSAE